MFSKRRIKTDLLTSSQTSLFRVYDKNGREYKVSKYLGDGKCTKFCTPVSDKMVYAKSADPDQTAPEGMSNQGLHCLQFY